MENKNFQRRYDIFAKKNMICLIIMKKLEYGIDTPCGTNGSRLSLGMQKIIMVIRGILKPNKSIVIYDEPLTSLDQETRKKNSQINCQ